MRHFEIGNLQPSEIEELLDLQNRNMKQNLTPGVAQQQGFLTFSYSFELVQAMMEDMQQPVAYSKDGLAGYALATSRNVGMSNSLLAPAIRLMETLELDGKSIGPENYYMMGQICIDENYRSLGIFDALYQQHKTLFSRHYDFLLTEISIHNSRSLAAHQRVGFKKVHIYNDGETDWQIVAWDWNY